jgi:hypothetical protein
MEAKNDILNQLLKKSWQDRFTGKIEVIFKNGMIEQIDKRRTIIPPGRNSKLPVKGLKLPSES